MRFESKRCISPNKFLALIEINRGVIHQVLHLQKGEGRGLGKKLIKIVARGDRCSNKITKKNN